MNFFKRSNGNHEPNTHTTNPHAEALRRSGFGGLVEKLTDPAEQQRLKSLWNTIDTSLQQTGITPQNRAFAGMNGGGRYFEVYSQPNKPVGAFLVVTAETGATQDTQPRFHEGRGEEFRGDPPLRVRFADPEANEQSCELGIRPVDRSRAGTTSYRIGNGLVSNGYEVFPMARLQADVGWTDQGVRGSFYDPHGDQTADLNVHTPPAPVQRQQLDDDLAV